jgi:uncharacterized protein (DUF2147 family)
MKCLQWLAAFLIASALASVAPAQENHQPFGVWRNGKNSVHIAVRPCGEALCGKVIWANDKAKADARNGTDSLVGTELLKDFRRNEEGRWRGKVFVPDIAQTFHGTLSLIDPDRLKARGCLFAGIICKSKIWIRVE